MKTLAILTVLVLLLPAEATASGARLPGQPVLTAQMTTGTGSTKNAPAPTSTTTTTRPARTAPTSGTAAASSESPTRTAAKPTSTSTTATTRPPSGSPIVQPSGLAVRGGQLILDGSPYRDVGLDAYELATDWGTNPGCGGMMTNAQLNSFFASLPTHTLVRFWAWQGTIGINAHTGAIDWSALDRVFDAAAAHHDLLLVSLTSQDGSCDNDVWKGLGWYSGGFKTTYGRSSNGQPLPMTYWQYVQAIVARYASSPALGMWEPVNEPEASTCPVGYSGTSCNGHQTCPSESAAAAAMRGFFDSVGGEIHALDPGSLVEAGFLGGGQCGTSGSDYQDVGASPGIDVLSYHDYYADTAAVGGDQWNGIDVRVGQSRNLDKPLISGETGIQAGDAAGCPSLADRKQDLAAKINGQSALGVEVFLFWDYVPSTLQGCSYDIVAGDPSLSLLKAT